MKTKIKVEHTRGNNIYGKPYHIICYIPCVKIRLFYKPISIYRRYGSYAPEHEVAVLGKDMGFSSREDAIKVLNLATLQGEVYNLSKVLHSEMDGFFDNAKKMFNELDRSLDELNRSL